MQTLHPKLVRVFPLIIQAYKERLQELQELTPNDVFLMIFDFNMKKGICYFSKWTLNESITEEVIMLDYPFSRTYWFKTPESIAEDHLMINGYLNLNKSHKKRMLKSMQLRVDKMEELLNQHNASLCS